MDKITNVQELIDDIIARRQQSLEMKISKYARYNLILSDINDCDRCNVYGVLNWEDKKSFTIDSVAAMEEGNRKEKVVISDLLSLGYDVRLQAEIVEIKGINGVPMARGKIDGKIRVGDMKIDVPFEIKSMDKYTFDPIKSIEDFEKKPWLRKYLRQIKMYMYGNNIEYGFFILEYRNRWKLLPVYLDYGECESILKMLERAYEHIKNKTYPDRIPYDQTICGMCNFQHICLQDVINTPAELIDNQEFADTLDRHEELKPLSSEYEKLHKKVKSAMGDTDKVIVNSRYLLQNVPSQRTSYEYPDDIKKQYAVKKPVNRLVIQRLGE